MLTSASAGLYVDGFGFTIHGLQYQVSNAGTAGGPAYEDGAGTSGLYFPSAGIMGLAANSTTQTIVTSTGTTFTKTALFQSPVNIAGVLTDQSSATISGVGGLGVTYGVSAATASFTATSTYTVTFSSGVQFMAPLAGIRWADQTLTTSALTGVGATGAQGAQGPAGSLTVNTVNASSFTISGTGAVFSTFTSYGALIASSTLQGQWIATNNMAPATMTITGMEYASSSGTVSALNGSTATVSTVLTTVSTGTLAAGTLLNAGDRALIECAFQNLAQAPGTPVEGVYESVLGALATTASVTVSQNIIVDTWITMVAVGKAQVFSQANGQAAAATVAISIAASAGILAVNFDATIAHTFFCKASRATGGSIQSAYMRISKL